MLELKKVYMWVACWDKTVADMKVMTLVAMKERKLDLQKAVDWVQ